MLEEGLMTYWAWVVAFFSEPRVAAAFPALIVSWGLHRDLKAAFIIAVIAYSTINLIIWLTSIPFGGTYTMTEPAAAGLGTVMALLGLPEIQARVKQANLKDVLQTVIAAVKDRRK